MPVKKTGKRAAGQNSGRFKKGSKPWNFNKKGCFSKDTIKKMSDKKKGVFSLDKHPGWKGGKYINAQGYVLVISKNHPYKNNDGYVREHRLVMEKHIGRFLLPTERVHHINNVSTDNRIKNLLLFKNAREHRRFHVKNGQINQHINIKINK